MISENTSATTGRPAPTPFESALGRLIVDETDRTLSAIDTLARQHDIDEGTVGRLVERFAGPDMAECWQEYIEAS